MGKTAKNKANKPPVELSPLGKLIEGAREAKGMSKAGLCRKSNLSPGTLSYILRTGQAKAENIELLSKALEIDIFAILSEWAREKHPEIKPSEKLQKLLEGNKIMAIDLQKMQMEINSLKDNVKEKADYISLLNTNHKQNETKITELEELSRFHIAQIESLKAENESLKKKNKAPRSRNENPTE